LRNGIPLNLSNKNDKKVQKAFRSENGKSDIECGYSPQCKIIKKL
jgi:hypothetical protein